MELILFGSIFTLSLEHSWIEPWLWMQNSLEGEDLGLQGCGGISEPGLGAEDGGVNPQHWEPGKTSDGHFQYLL